MLIGAKTDTVCGLAANVVQPVIGLKILLFETTFKLGSIVLIIFILRLIDVLLY